MKYSRLESFGEISIDGFLKDYWQKKPLLVKRAFPDFACPLDAETLAGYALEEEVKSRLIIEKSPQNWELTHGPLSEDIFPALSDSHWTLLVQNVDDLNEGVHALLEAFKFIPSWRLDDIMISYATDQGSVGPHFDYYDVFLLQAQGKRQWKIGQNCSSDSALLPNQEMKILENFETRESYIVEPGDLLYLPPGLAHWGIAQGECMTFSVGFRAPSYADILLETAQELASELNEDLRYRDIHLSSHNLSGEISDDVINSLKDVLSSALENKQKLAQSFGKLMTRKNPGLEFDSEPCLDTTAYVKLKPHARCAWYASNGAASLFIDGELYSCSKNCAVLLSEKRAFQLSELDTSDMSLVHQLIEENLIVGN